MKVVNKKAPIAQSAIIKPSRQRTVRPLFSKKGRFARVSFRSLQASASPTKTPIPSICPASRQQVRSLKGPSARPRRRPAGRYIHGSGDWVDWLLSMVLAAAERIGTTTTLRCIHNTCNNPQHQHHTAQPPRHATTRAGRRTAGGARRGGQQRLAAPTHRATRLPPMRRPPPPLHSRHRAATTAAAAH